MEKRCACAYKIARGRRMGGCRWPPRMHYVLRLCIKSSPGHVKYTDNKNTQNARISAPVYTKWSAVGRGSDNRWQSRMHQVLRLRSRNAPRHDKSQLAKTQKMHETQSLCIQNGPQSENGWTFVGSPECAKYCACAAEAFRGMVNPRLANEI